MDKKQLREWVGAWADRYPVQDDEPLATFAGRESLDRDAMAVMVRWKFNNMAPAKQTPRGTWTRNRTGASRI